MLLGMAVSWFSGSGPTPPPVTSNLIGPLSATVVSGTSWKVGDTGPDLIVDLADSTGARPDLTGATITFRLRSVAGQEIALSGVAAAWPDQTAHPGRVSYTWADGDIAVAGAMLGDFGVIDAIGVRYTYPDDAYIDLVFLETA
jgi:hypothetical protein